MNPINWILSRGERSGKHATVTDREEHVASLLSSLLTMAWFVEARDPYTGGHLWRVSRYSGLLAEHAGLDATAAARISLGAFLHDLGKVGVPDAVLRKRDTLTDLEFAVIRTHPDMGMRLLAGHPLAPLVHDAILLHHERIDGGGYPHGLRGEAIPPTARVVGLCDAFDAMTSQRPYRAAMPLDWALEVIGRESGAQFDACLASAFIELGALGKLSHVLGHSDEGIPLRTCPMCGPTLVVRRDHRASDRIYCRECKGEFELESVDGFLQPAPTGQQGTASDLEPEADKDLIARTVKSAVSSFPSLEMLAREPASQTGIP